MRRVLVCLATALSLALIFASAPAARGQDTAPTARIYAARLGLIGRTTANGRVIQERDRFVALPAASVLSSRGGHEYQVRITYRGRVSVAPVWDVGPWNQTDGYWAAHRRGAPDLPRFLPQAEAAFTWRHNDGRSLSGHAVTAPFGIDLADGVFWDDLSMTESDWVDVTFLWLHD